MASLSFRYSFQLVSEFCSLYAVLEVLMPGTCMLRFCIKRGKMKSADMDLSSNDTLPLFVANGEQKDAE